MTPPASEKSQLKRHRNSIPEGEIETKKPRRSERLSQAQGHEKTPVSHKQHLPSPVTHQTESSELVKEPTATPPSKQDSGREYNSQGFSSPLEQTQPFSQTLDPQEAVADQVEDEIKEGVWGYLFPLGDEYTTKITVLKNRTACPGSDTVAKAIDKKDRGKLSLQKETEAYDKTKIKNPSSGGYLIGRHPECDVIIEDPIVSNRHCLLFSENKGNDTVAVLEDLSSNGTFVNDTIVGRNQRRELQEQDEITVLDKARFIFRYPKSRKSSAFLQQYTLLEKLGKGHFAEVYLCVERSTGKEYAVKVFSKQPGEARSKTEGLQQEIAVLKSVSHPNVLCLKDTFNEPNAVYIVLELAPEGELFNLIVSKQKLTENEARKLFVQLFEGIKYLHDRNIVHRDIKPENILMTDTQLHAKLADFGLAKIIGEESFTTTLCGTPSYVAPEILADTKQRKYTKAVDIWSLGVVLYICLCGFPPFSDELYSKRFPFTLPQQIKSGRFDYPSPYWDSVGDPALDLIDSMLIVDPEKRFTIDQCINHPWIKTAMPGANDSTNGLVGGIANLDMGRRGVKRERTLLSELNNVHQARVPAGKNGTVAVFSKNKDRVTNAPASQKEAGPAHDRNADEFAAMGGKGDQTLFADENDSIYTKTDVKDKEKSKKAKKPVE